MHDKAMEEFKAMMDELMAEKEKQLGLGSEKFLQRHEEIMAMIEKTTQEMKGAREKGEHPTMDA